MEEIEKKETSAEASTPLVVKEVQNEEPKKKSKGLYIVIGTLSVILLVLVGYLVYTKYFSNTEITDDTQVEETQEEEDTTTDDAAGVCSIDGECEEEEETEEESTTKEFDGEYLTATLPKGWNVIEYTNGEGTDYLLEGTTYTGLTGLAITNASDERVFSMMAVTGIGFVGCPEYYMFEDDSASYKAQMQSVNDEVGDTWTVIDYTDTEYSEFDWLGTTIRRIEDLYLYDTEEGNNYFEAPCHTGIINLEGLTFTDSDGYTGEAYFYGAEDTATEADLLVVDTILESFKVVE